MAPTPGELAFLDQAVAEFTEVASQLAVGAQALVARVGREQAIGQLVGIFEDKYGSHPRVLAGLLAAALVQSEHQNTAGG